MKLISTLALTCVALAAPALPVEARTSQQTKSNDSHSAPRPPYRWWATENYQQELKLTAEQSAEIEQIVQGSMARLKGDKEDLDRAQSDFLAVMERPTASERELIKAAERLEMARFSISKERTTMIVRIHSILTPGQRHGLNAIAKQHEADRNHQK